MSRPLMTIAIAVCAAILVSACGSGTLTKYRKKN